MSGGIVMALLTSFLYQIRSYPAYVWDRFSYYTTITLRFESGSPDYVPACKYLMEKHGNSSFGTFFDIEDADFKEKVPGGFRWGFTRWCYVSYYHNRREMQMAKKGDPPVVYSIHIDIFGWRRNAVKQEVQDYINKARSVTPLKAKFNDNERKTLKTRRLEDLAIDFSDELKADLDWFVNNREWYEHRGIPYRRGYLFYGPPGTGKSSLGLAIANYLQRDLYVFTQYVWNVDNALQLGDCVVVFEDFDCQKATQKRKTSNKEEDPFNAEDQDEIDEVPLSAMTSTLLNLIDGPTAGEGSILIFTSNHPDNLDPAFKRPGRMDRQFEVGYLNNKTFQRLVKIYYDLETDLPVPGQLTPAEAQEIHIQYPTSFEDFYEQLQRKAASVLQRGRLVGQGIPTGTGGLQGDIDKPGGNRDPKAITLENEV